MVAEKGAVACSGLGALLTWGALGGRGLLTASGGPVECGGELGGPEDGGGAQREEEATPALAPGRTCRREIHAPVEGRVQQRVMVGGKAMIFTDPQKLQQFIAKKEAKG
ncbi:hypothetical protein NDU88_007781 [Pleurodeles waltl]|uniref:Uncharacterized protein n=1 Tax=Pleurodeles waltl TaxID=8319 RepID=A0AAV7N330_PLEWA|nr:hypothetical protein NDU88_007781 [Pleurodeles waltl]